MVFIPFPRVDLDGHEDLKSWRANLEKKKDDWKVLKPYLAKHAQFTEDHPLPKCWYTELPQGDNYALDVEHFRPKNQASPLSQKHLDILEPLLGYSIRQLSDEGSYPWLEFDYRNYRLTTAWPNRAGGKHVYFPLPESTSRFSANVLPWDSTKTENEYPLLLDPTDIHDANQLLVVNSGLVIPKASNVPLEDKHLSNIADYWRSDVFNYLRSMITIELYRINDERILINARKKYFENVQLDLDTLAQAVNEKASDRLISMLIQPIIKSILPSAPFSLASKCGFDAYVVDAKLDQPVRDAIIDTMHIIRNSVDNYTMNAKVDWTAN